MFTLPIAAVAAIVYGAYALMGKEPLRRAQFLRREGVCLGVLLGLFWLLSVFAELFTDAPVAETWAWAAASIVPAILGSWIALGARPAFPDPSSN